MRNDRKRASKAVALGVAMALAFSAVSVPAQAKAEPVQCVRDCSVPDISFLSSLMALLGLR